MVFRWGGGGGGGGGGGWDIERWLGSFVFFSGSGPILLRNPIAL